LSEPHTLTVCQNEPGLYEIRLKGHLDNRWADWLMYVTIILEDNGYSLLICRVADQAALHGLLKRVRDLGLPLISVNFISHDQARPQEDKQ
jgi:hypothetical protein